MIIRAAAAAFLHWHIAREIFDVLDKDKDKKQKRFISQPPLSVISLDKRSSIFIPIHDYSVETHLTPTHKNFYSAEIREKTKPKLEEFESIVSMVDRFTIEIRWESSRRIDISLYRFFSGRITRKIIDSVSIIRE